MHTSYDHPCRYHRIRQPVLLAIILCVENSHDLDIRTDAAMSSKPLFHREFCPGAILITPPRRLMIHK